MNKEESNEGKMDGVEGWTEKERGMVAWCGGLLKQRVENKGKMGMNGAGEERKRMNEEEKEGWFE